MWDWVGDCLGAHRAARGLFGFSVETDHPGDAGTPPTG